MTKNEKKIQMLRWRNNYQAIFWSFTIAFSVSSLLQLTSAYGSLLSEFSSQGLFFLWQLLGSYILPISILILSLFVVILPNPIYALICLILVFFSAAVFLLSIKVNFLAMIYLIIYIGAIAILFLFVIMMFDLRELQQPSSQINDSSFLSVSFSLCFLILYKFYGLLLDNIVTFVDYDKYFNDFTRIKFESLRYFLTYQHTDTLLFGTLLYDYYSYLFLVSALILLTSMLGSIILALSTTEKTINS
jgi:NADH:ubiquinone oxidoreductase subunit 6 (subunit J)